MDHWESVIRTTAAVISALGGLAVLIWSKIRENEAMARDVTAIKGIFLIRNWLLLTVGTVGVAAMVSVVLVPLSPVSVLVCAVGAVFAAVGASAILMLEMSRMSSKYFWDALALHSKAQYDTTQRVVSVLESVALPAKHATDKPD